MKKRLFIFALSIVAALSGCDEAINDSAPVSVARSFWNAALSINPSDATPFITNGDPTSLGIKGSSEEDTARLGKMTQQDGYYFIDTTLQLSRSGQLVAIPMRTVVVPVDGVWKVDYNSTKQSIFDATFDTSMKWYASTLTNAGEYVENILNVEDGEGTLVYAEARLDEEFELVKAAMLNNYKYRLKSNLDQKKTLKETTAPSTGD